MYIAYVHCRLLLYDWFPFVCEQQIDASINAGEKNSFAKIDHVVIENDIDDDQMQKLDQGRIGFSLSLSLSLLSDYKSIKKRGERKNKKSWLCFYAID